MDEIKADVTDLRKSVTLFHPSLKSKNCRHCGAVIRAKAGNCTICGKRN